MPLPDDHPDKWVLKEHTEVKHQILRKYLTTWTRIVSSTNPELHFFDAFAGRATYEGEISGSPILALDVADDHADQFDTFHCTFNELDENNFENLSNVISKYKNDLKNSSKISIDLRNKEFGEIALEIMQSQEYRDLPSLVFIDPFGYDGIPFKIVDRVINLKTSGNEIFFTFMVDKVRRFLSDDEKSETITNLMGTEEWTKVSDIDHRENKEEALLRLYTSQLKQVADVDYAFPFQMIHPDKETTVYYLIHATNHFKGLKVMKDVMFREGADEQFAYLGAEHYGYDDAQTKLFDTTNTEDTRITALADYLYDRFEGSQLRYWEILKRTYTDTDLIDKHYKKAIDKLVEKDEATVHNFPDRPRGSSSGKKPDDEIEFCQTNRRLTDF